MANFQFGQDNVGGGWSSLPPGYMQGMSASPMATGISGIAAAIANAAQQYQQARQNAFMEQMKQRQFQAEQGRASTGYGLEQQRIDLAKEQFKAQQEQAKQAIENQRRYNQVALGLRGIFTGESEPSLPQDQSTSYQQPSMQLFPPYGLEPATPTQYNLGDPSMMYGQYPQY